jgi:CO/xanthine dehydrogenase FAD-binding subunit
MLRANDLKIVLEGKRVQDTISACCEAALDRAKPLSKNRYKVAAAKGVLKQALTSLI